MIRLIVDNTLGSTLFALALAGLSFLAYWEPLGYRRLHNYLWPSLSIIYVFYFTFEMGVLSGRSRMWPYVAAEKFDQAQGASTSDFGSFSILLIGLMLFLTFLRFLGPLLGRAPKEGGIFIGVVSGDETPQSSKAESDAK